MNEHLTFYSSVPTLCIKSDGCDLPPVRGEVMYGFQLPRECRDFAKLCTDQAAYSKPMFPPEARDIVHRPLHRKLDAAISATFHVNEPKRASMDIDAGEQVFPELSRILQILR
jgi:hypothetical protein